MSESQAVLPTVNHDWRRMLRQVNWSAYGIVGATVLIWIGFNIATGGLFLSSHNLSQLMVQTVVLGICVCGMVLVMVAGHIDLSVGSAIGLTATVLAFTQVNLGWPAPMAVGAALVTGLVLGAWQGAWLAATGIPAFIVTLAGLTLFRGLTFLMTNGQTFAPVDDAVSEIANGSLSPVGGVAVIVLVIAVLVGSRLRSAAGVKQVCGTPNYGRALLGLLPVVVFLLLLLYVTYTYRGLPFAVLLLAAVALALAFVANRTKFGRHLYAIGGGPAAASLAGISVARNSFVLFVGMGLIYGISGTVLASRLGGAPPDPAFGMELDVITAAIIGGTSMSGGVGTIRGAIVGALLLTSVSNGLDLMGVNSYFQFVVKGMILLLAVVLDLAMKRRSAS